MKGLSKLALAAATCAAVSSAQAITFTNVVVNGPASLIAGNVPTTGATDIDFAFPNAVVGDGQSLRSGTINITYEATSAIAMDLNQLVFSSNALLLGSGYMKVQEVVEDVATGDVLASFEQDFFAPSGSGAFTTNLTFTRPTKHFKAKKTISLFAVPNTQAVDLAGIRFVEQNIRLVPEPASMTALCLGIAGVVARKRRGGR
jgi:hypothetical protein